MMRRGFNQGNVLFLILIAVALFAALSYAVTNSTRSSGSASKESNKLIVSNLRQFASSIDLNFMRMTIDKGIAPTDVILYDGTNGQCPPSWTLCTSGDRCLFAPEGGGYTSMPRLPSSYFVSPAAGNAYPGSSDTMTNIYFDCIDNMSNWDIGLEGEDRAFYISNVSEEVCRLYNESYDIEGIVGVDITEAELDRYTTISYCSFDSATDRYNIAHLFIIQ